ncbi:MAG TPA: hypothetical protein VJJ75_02835 [Candidatus Nanoarchaeia archaeon]|nr:hypothetical protein [Candidatus Nanoarchaeia archaeon]
MTPQTLQDKDETIKNIVIERLRQMSPNFKVALGDRGRFLKRDELIKEIEDDTSLGHQIIKIQLLYLESLKKGT